MESSSSRTSRMNTGESQVDRPSPQPSPVPRRGRGGRNNPLLNILRQYVPQLATLIVWLLLFAFASLSYEKFFTLRTFMNFFYNNAFIGVAAVGMTYVILSGGIDLSVGAMMAFTSILMAKLIGVAEIHPATAMFIVLAIGAGYGAVVGLAIHAFELPAFLITLAGMFFVRGLGFVVEKQQMSIQHPFYDAVIDARLPVTEDLGLPMVVLAMFAAFALGAAVLRWTRFGRNIYAIGGSETSALLMGVPVGRTKVAIYAISGFTAALAGVVYSVFTGAGDPAAGVGLELDVIACVVIGGTLLTGGSGNLFGTLLGVLIFATIKAGIAFDGRLNSWWIRIAIGALLLGFILMQKWIGRERR